MVQLHERTRLPLRKLPQGGANGLIMASPSPPSTPPRTKIEWWSEVVAGQGLQEVQAHPSHTQKVTVDSEFCNRNVFILEKRWEPCVHVHEVLKYEICLFMNLF